LNLRDDRNFVPSHTDRFFAPVGAAVKATQIGQTMIEVTARPDEFENGDKIGTWKIIRYSDAYEVRQ